MSYNNLPKVSNGWPANFSMLYLSISCNLPSMGSDFGIRPVDISGGSDKGPSGKDNADIGLFIDGKWLAIEAVNWLGLGVLRAAKGNSSNLLLGLLGSILSGLPISEEWEWSPPLVRLWVALLILEFSSAPGEGDLPFEGDRGGCCCRS
jgi:hypothetical protein